MKKLPIVLLFVFACIGCFSQQNMDYVKATNCNCYLYTIPANIGSLTWVGNCNYGYCVGYGTARYYDKQGNYFGEYIGNVVSGKKDGYGTYYGTDGSLWMQGNFVKGQFVSSLPYSLLQNLIGDYIIDSLFDGGINRSCSLVKAVFTPNGDVKELRYAMTFDGDIISSNHYVCTLVIKDTAPYIDFVNYNDNAEAYLTIKVAQLGYQFVNWLSQEVDKNNN